MRLLVCSLPDRASVNIRDRLLETEEWKALGEFDGNTSYQRGSSLMVSINELHLRADNIDRKVSSSINSNIEEVIFLSRHRAASGKKSLTVHPIGNFRKAEFGGREGMLVPPSPDIMTSIMRRLKKEAAGLDFEVAFEVTHHGPYLETPSLFVEIGSSEESWGSMEAARAVASSITDFREVEGKKVIGIGGGHYAPRFTEVSLSKKVSFGHMLPNYAFDLANKEETKGSIRKALDATGTNLAYIHKKSMKRSEVTSLNSILGELGAEAVDSSAFDDLSD